jgi:hypothetical protein
VSQWNANGPRDIGERLTRKKKTGHAVEQDRADVLTKRRAWFEAQPDLDPSRLVFIDETWTATNMARTHGRSARGERLRMGFPHGATGRPRRWSRASASGA